MLYAKPVKKHLKLSALACLALLLMTLLSACGGDPQTQQRATQNKSNFDKALSHAKEIGVPDSYLQSITQQSTQIGQTSAPVPILDQPVNDYYSNLATRYQLLTLQVQGVEKQATEELSDQAKTDLEKFNDAVAQRQGQKFVSAQKFGDILTQQQKNYAGAKLPKDFVAVSSVSKMNTEALQLMGPTNDKLNTFNDVIKQLKASKIDTTAADQQATDDKQIFRDANTPDDFNRLSKIVDNQINQLAALSTQAIPYVGAAKLKQYSSMIDDMKKYGVDSAPYEKKLNDDKAALDNAKTLSDFLKISTQIDADLASAELPLYKGKAQYLLKQFHDKVKAFESSHTYYNAYNKTTYPMGYEYDTKGIGEDLDKGLASDKTKSDYLDTIHWIEYTTDHLQAMIDNYGSKVPYNQVHDTDTRLLQLHNMMTGGPWMVVSLSEQAMRVYQDGKLIRSTLVVTGQFELPSVPGIWPIIWRVSPTVFKSSYPKGSPYYYEDTPINYAMEYHTGGYFFHDSYWRSKYGPGMQFPHYDPGGPEGSHGCINLPPAEAKWLYQSTSYSTRAIIY